MTCLHIGREFTSELTRGAMQHIMIIASSMLTILLTTEWIFIC